MCSEACSVSVSNRCLNSHDHSPTDPSCPQSTRPLLALLAFIATSTGNHLDGTDALYQLFQLVCSPCGRVKGMSLQLLFSKTDDPNTRPQIPRRTIPQHSSLEGMRLSFLRLWTLLLFFCIFIRSNTVSSDQCTWAKQRHNSHEKGWYT